MPDENTGNATIEVGSGRGKLSLRKLKTFDSFRNPVYSLYYFATAGQWASGSMQMVARSLLIYRITGSGAILGGMALAQALPVFFLSLFGGVLADRVQKKYILFGGQVASALVATGIGLALTTGYLGTEHSGSWWILIIGAVLQGTVQSLMMPSSQAIIREIVTEEQVMNAVSLGNMGQNTFQLIGPALGGFLIDAFNFNILYFVIAGINLIGSILFIFMPHTRTIESSANNPFKDIPEGFRYVRHETKVWLVLLFALISSMLGMPLMQMLPMFTEDILNIL